jgi:hypothetical protein
MRLLFLLLVITIASCNNNNDQKVNNHENDNKHLSPISLWLTAHEDTLFQFMSEFIKQDTANNKPEGETISRQYVIDYGIMGRLRDLINTVAGCIRVYYAFKPKQNPWFEIVLTPEYDSACVEATDSIFSDIKRLKYFSISKYIQPEGLFSAQINGRDTVRPSDLAFQLIPGYKKYDLIFYLRKDISDNTKRILINSIFGEEVLLKKIRSVTYERLKESAQGLKTIEEVKEELGVRN